MEDLLKIKAMLDFSIVTGSLLTFTNEEHRGKGKTSVLIETAKMMEINLIVKGENQARALREDYDYPYILNGDYINLQKLRSTRGLGFSTGGVLVDVGLTNKELRELSKHTKILGGFSSI